MSGLTVYRAEQHKPTDWHKCSLQRDHLHGSDILHVVTIDFYY